MLSISRTSVLFVSLCALVLTGCGDDEPNQGPGKGGGAAVQGSPQESGEGSGQQSPGQQPAGPKKPSWTGMLNESDFARLHELKQDQAPPLHGTMIELPSGERAYLALPKGEAPFPALTVIHEWWGLNEHVKHWADRLAAAGYAALAVDLYGGQVATTRDRAMELMQGVDEAKAKATLASAHRFLAEDQRVRASKRGSIGWCFGGAWSLTMALEHGDLDAVVLYYGRLVTDPEQLAKIEAPLLAVFGNKDASIPPDRVDEFATALEKAEVEHEILRYDAEHAFANPSSARYAAEPAAAAWKRVQEFLAAKLKG